MLSVAEAQERTRAAVSVGPPEWLPLAASLGRVLASPLTATRDQPPAALSAMDGYAVRAADTDNPERPLSVVGEAPAGRPYPHALRPGCAVRIFTGGVVPEGADAILIQENAAREADTVHALESCEAGRFVRPAGLDFTAGGVVLDAPRVIDPTALALAGVAGAAWVEVRRRPKVAILATGDELVRPGEPSAVHQVVSSNSLALAAMVRLWGAEPLDLGIARDSRADLARALDAAKGADLVLTTGGASVGEHDLVREVAASAGLKLEFWKIAMRPGKPLIFGDLNGTPFLGLPGNPVSAAVCAIVFARGMIRARLGLPAALPWTPMRLAVDVPANDGREELTRATLATGPDGQPAVLPASKQDSSMLGTLARSSVLARRPVRDLARKAGDAIDALLLAEIWNPFA